MPENAFTMPETLRQYAVLADGERGALIGPRGDIALMCAPQWHSPALFSSLIGGSGDYSVTPLDRYVWGGAYEPGGLVWRSRWVTEHGVTECREALAFPGDRDHLVLLRRILAVRGDARVRVALDPRADFGDHPARLRGTGTPGLWEGEAGGLRLRWQGAPESAGLDGTAVVGETIVPAGGSHDLVLEVSAGPLPWAPVDAERAWQSTTDAWRRHRTQLRDSVAPADVDHAHAVLRGLTSSSGAMVAAATMSLPERSDTGRNYDYRYAWIRDQCYAGEAAAAAGADGLLQSALDFVSGRVLDDGPQLRPAYTVDAGPVPDEMQLDLAGYPGGSDTVGNWVNKQFQLDAFGEVLLLLAAGVRAGATEARYDRAARTAARAIADRWQEPDAGIWELENRVWTHSRLICAAGLRTYAATVPGRTTRDWDELAGRLVREADRTARHRSGRWQRAVDDAGVDASLLLPALRGAVPADDPRTVATVEAVRDELTQDGYVYRFRHGDMPLSEAEGAFLLCGLHMAMAVHQQGDPVAAAHWFERSRGAVGPPALFTEEFDVVQHQLRGNLPQSFVHAALMESAVRLAESPSRWWKPARAGTKEDR